LNLLDKTRYYSGVYYASDFSNDRQFAAIISSPSAEKKNDGWRNDFYSLDIVTKHGMHDVLNATEPGTEEETQQKVLRHMNKLLFLGNSDKVRVDFIPVHGSYDDLMSKLHNSEKTNIPKWVFHVK